MSDPAESPSLYCPNCDKSSQELQDHYLSLLVTGMCYNCAEQERHILNNYWEEQDTYDMATHEEKL